MLSRLVAGERAGVRGELERSRMPPDGCTSNIEHSTLNAERSKLDVRCWTFDVLIAQHSPPAAAPHPRPLSPDHVGSQGALLRGRGGHCELCELQRATPHSLCVWTSLR